MIYGCPLETGKQKYKNDQKAPLLKPFYCHYFVQLSAYNAQTISVSATELHSRL